MTVKLQQEEVEKAHLLQSFQTLARSQMNRQEYKDAIGSLEAVLTLDPKSYGDWCELGTCWINLQNREAAEACFRQAHRLKPTFASALVALADLECSKRPADGRRAMQYLERARAHLRFGEANELPYYVARVHALEALGKLEQAEETARYIVDKAPTWANGLMALGNVLAARGKHLDALPFAKQAWDSTGDTRLAMNYALSSLCLGDWETGWRAYEARLKDPNHEGYRRFGKAKYWNGEPLEGNLLVYCEQGLGDLVQFSRYWIMPKITTAVRGKILIEVWKSQLEIASILFKDLPYCQVVEIPELGTPKVEYAAWCGMMSGPRLSGHPGLDSVPPASVKLGKYYVGDVALIWYGNPEFAAADLRDLSLECFRGYITAHPELTFWTPIPELRAMQDITQSRLPVKQVKGTLKQCWERLAASKLVLACDTGTMHMAALAGVETHLFIPEHYDWRWMQGGRVWYENLTIHRHKDRYAARTLKINEV